MRLAHALVKLVVVGGCLFGSDRVNLFEKPSRDDAGCLLADRIEVGHFAPENVFQFHRRGTHSSGELRGDTGVGSLLTGISDDEHCLLSFGHGGNQLAEKAHEIALAGSGKAGHVDDEFIEQYQ